MRRTPTAVTAAALAASACLGATLLTGCATQPQGSDTYNGITPGPPPPSGVVLPTHYPLPGGGAKNNDVNGSHDG